MPTQVFNCPKHGEFDINIPFSLDVPQTYPCPNSWCGDKSCCDPCERPSLHVIKPPAGIIVVGGTGAGRGNGAARAQLSWDTKANEMQHDPYTQAKVQSEHVYHEQKDMGRYPEKVTEAQVQATAAAIASDEASGNRVGKASRAVRRDLAAGMRTHRKARRG